MKKKILCLLMTAFLAVGTVPTFAEDGESSSEWVALNDSGTIFKGPTDIYGENRDNIDNPFYRYIDAEEAAEASVPIYKSTIDTVVSKEMYLNIEESGYYITPDSSGNYVYITDKEGNRLLKDKFKCVYNMISNGELPVRYYGTSDFSGLALLDAELEEIISPGGCNYFTRKTNDYNDIGYIGIKRNTEGNIQVCRYISSGFYDWSAGKESLHIWSDKYYISCDRFAMNSLTNANEAGLLGYYLNFKEIKDAAERYDFVSLAVQAVLFKENTDIYTYIRKNNITVNYDKYLDIVSPDIALAEAVGLIKPAEGKYFNPNTPITRQEAAYTLNRLCEILGVPLTSYDKILDDDSEIEDWAKEAVYNVSGTFAEDTRIMAPSLPDNKFYPDDEFKLENAIACIWRIYDFENTGAVKTDIRYNCKNISPELYAFQNSDGKWGVCKRDSVKTLVVEPIYEFASSLSWYNYMDEYSTYYTPRVEAYVNGGVFVLSNKPNARSSERDNTYYVFNTEGELLKTFHYGSEEMKADLPEEYADMTFSVSYASGSNLIFSGLTVSVDGEKYYPCYIKRLMSEIAVTGYFEIEPSSIYDGEFTAIDPETMTYCLLNPDGSFKEYYDGDPRLRLKAE